MASMNSEATDSNLIRPSQRNILPSAHFFVARPGERAQTRPARSVVEAILAVPSGGVLGE
jgi:hypothetical protein